MKSEPQPITQEWLDSFAEGRDEVVQALFNAYISNEPKRFADLKKALEERNMPELGYLAHSMKGGAATLGAEPVRMACLAVEKAAKAGEFDLAAEKMIELEKEMERTYTFMHAHLEKLRNE
jgi:HPt (histidine-containing phosphotransfer) domain-containing protein